jgi:hypothetical protein
MGASDLVLRLVSFLLGLLSLELVLGELLLRLVILLFGLLLGLDHRLDRVVLRQIGLVLILLLLQELLLLLAVVVVDGGVVDADAGIVGADAGIAAAGVVAGRVVDLLQQWRQPAWQRGGDVRRQLRQLNCLVHQLHWPGRDIRFGGAGQGGAKEREQSDGAGATRPSPPSHDDVDAAPWLG